MLGHRRPAFVIDAAITQHLEVLKRSAARSFRVVEGVAHADALDWPLRHAVDHNRLRQAEHVENRWRDVDHVMPLAPDLTHGLDALGPVDDQAIARATVVRRYLFGPLERAIARMREAN